jgi:hypothetical protein
MVASLSPQLSPSSRPHVHLAGELCPYCEQQIPNEKAEQVRARAEAKERELSEILTARLTQKFAVEKAQIEARSKALVDQASSESAAALEKLRSEIASKEAAAREEGKKAAEAMLQERLAEQEQTSKALIEVLEERLEDAQRGKTEAVGQIEVLKTQHQVEINRHVQEAREATEQAMQQKLAEQEQAASGLIGSLQDKLAEAERSKQEAAVQAEALKAAHETETHQRVQEVREALEADKNSALNGEKAKHFEETQKLRDQLAVVTRQLENKNANELGEGAEIDLYETLKGEFGGDRIRRVGKGAPGADIIHEIVHNDKVCGKIVYDSKNRNAWRYEYVTKLREDQHAERAEHAILAALKFPADHRQLCVQDGVIIANPARVLSLVQLLRRHIVQVHSMRISNNERSQKIAALYEFIRSEQCQQLFERIDSQAEDLLELQEQDKRAHDKMWNRQGTLVRGIQKARSELTLEIDRIIGTAGEVD